jgi:hypothetical protein
MPQLLQQQQHSSPTTVANSRENTKLLQAFLPLHTYAAHVLWHAPAPPTAAQQPPPRLRRHPLQHQATATLMNLEKIQTEPHRAIIVICRCSYLCIHTRSSCLGMLQFLQQQPNNPEAGSGDEKLAACPHSALTPLHHHIVAPRAVASSNSSSSSTAAQPMQ